MVLATDYYSFSAQGTVYVCVSLCAVYLWQKTGYLWIVQGAQCSLSDDGPGNLEEITTQERIAIRSMIGSASRLSMAD